MADLDDFFARKDKKKSKAKPKFPGVDEIPKGDDTKIEEPAVAAAVAVEKKNTENVEQQQQQQQQQQIATTVEVNQQQQQQVEEEWKDFEEEQRKDYTGLKIGQLTINDDESTSDEEEVDSDGNIAPESNKRGGPQPWKKVIPAEEVTQIPMEPEKPTSKVYISPALRAQQLSGMSSRPKARRTAPDITNADYFPSLDAARPEKQRRKKNEPAFEEVRHGGRLQRVEGQQIAQPAAATNRFQSLDDDDS